MYSCTARSPSYTADPLAAVLLAASVKALLVVDILFSRHGGVFHDNYRDERAKGQDEYFGKPFACCSSTVVK